MLLIILVWEGEALPDFFQLFFGGLSDAFFVEDRVGKKSSFSWDFWVCFGDFLLSEFCPFGPPAPVFLALPLGAA